MSTTRLETLDRLRRELALRTPASDTTASFPIRSDVEPATGASQELRSPKHSLLLTVPEACAELRISRAQFYILANKQRAIESVHIGKLCRIPRQALEQYVDGLRSGVQL